MSFQFVHLVPHHPANSHVSCHITLLPTAPGAAQVGSFLHVKRPQWKAGDVLAASFGMRPRFLKLNDDRDAYDNVGSLHYGPFLLVGECAHTGTQTRMGKLSRAWLTQ